MDLAEARAKDAWGRTSALMALIANCHRDPKKSRPLKPADFNPFRGAGKEEPIPADMAALKAVFTEGRWPATEDET